MHCSRAEELDALIHGSAVLPPAWRPGIVGMVIDEDTDWDEVAELLTDSWCLLAPPRSHTSCSSWSDRRRCAAPTGGPVDQPGNGS